MLIRKTLLVAAAVLAFTGIHAQDQTQNADQGQLLVKAPNVQKRVVGPFHAIHVSNAIDLVLKQGNEDGVAVSAMDVALRDRIITRVENGVLLIYFETKGFHMNWVWTDRKIKAFVSFKMLDELTASGSSDMYVDGSIQSDNLKIDLSGSSDFKGAVKVGQLGLSQSGSSDVKIQGSATNLRIGLSGASDVKGYDLVVDNCTIDASGSSDVYITVNKELRVAASGSSDVHYKGEAEVVNVRSSGSSSVSKKG
jgi:hypothetical protein